MASAIEIIHNQIKQASNKTWKVNLTRMKPIIVYLKRMTNCFTLFDHIYYTTESWLNRTVDLREKLMIYMQSMGVTETFESN